MKRNTKQPARLYLCITILFVKGCIDLFINYICATILNINSMEILPFKRHFSSHVKLEEAFKYIYLKLKGLRIDISLYFSYRLKS